MHYSYTSERKAEPEVLSGERFDRVEQEEVHKLLKDIIFLERELESCKIELSLKPDFNLLDAFKMLDTSNLGYLSFTELSSRLSMTFDLDTIGIQGLEGMQLLFDRYDTTKDQRLSLAEFCRAFTPLTSEYA